MNLRPLERSLTSSSERALFEKFLMYFSFGALMFRAKVFLRLFHLYKRLLFPLIVFRLGPLESEKHTIEYCSTLLLFTFIVSLI